MKTDKPLILTAQIAAGDLAPFNLLRAEHFPADRNFLLAHLTMFHRLPGEYEAQIRSDLAQVSGQTPRIDAEVSGLRHLGAGVAFSISSPELQAVRGELRARFVAWLGSQDMQPWRPHVTIQNKASRAAADALHARLSAGFQSYSIAITGLQLWAYRGGPWDHLVDMPFE